MKRAKWLLRVSLVVAALVVIWILWRPVSVQLPSEIMRVMDAAALAALPAGATFLVEGVVTPGEDAGGRDWLGRFAFVQKQQQDLGGAGASKHRVLAVVDDHRPALRFAWKGGVWTVPAWSYSLEHASPVEPRAWPRKWFWTTRVDTWDDSSAGLSAGETVLAMGRIDDHGKPKVASILRTPLESVVAEMKWENRARYWLTLGAKLMLTVFVVSLLRKVKIAE